MHKKILLKLSGEFLQSETQALDMTKIEKLAEQIQEFIKQDIQVAIVLGAGNIMRGRSIDRNKYSSITSADYSGMLGTVINALMLRMVLEDNLHISTYITSPFNITSIIDFYNPEKAKEEIESGRVVILGGGTGKPGVSTDTAAMNLGADLGVEAVYKGTLVDGVYSDDPKQNFEAEKFTELTYAEALEKGLKIMDKTAFAAAQQNNLTTVVFKWDDDSIAKLLAGESIGTTIS